MNLLITVCAREGSMGLPRKAMLDMHGRPLAEWTIQHAKEAASFLECDMILSSDGEAILGLGQKCGIPIHRRPRGLAQDDTPKMDAIRNAVTAAEQDHCVKYDVVMDLDICNPLRTPEDILVALAMFLNDPHCPVLFSVVKAKRTGDFNQVRDIGQGRCILALDSDSRNVIRRQDAMPIYDLNNSVFVYDRDWLMNPANRTSTGSNPPRQFYLMAPWSCVDIDVEDDFEDCRWRMAKYMLAERVEPKFPEHTKTEEPPKRKAERPPKKK